MFNKIMNTNKKCGANTMKKWLLVILICVISVTSSTFVNATTQDENAQSDFLIEFNGQNTDYISFIYNNVQYVPVRKIFEKMGATVFYRARDNQILILTRDGDMIYHIAGEHNITVNGVQKICENPSVLIHNETYIPVDMVSATGVINEIWCDSQQLHIQKNMLTSDNHKLVKDVLDLCSANNFYPERFQRYIKYHAQMPDYNICDVINLVNIGLDYPFYENVTTIEHPCELLVLVNKYNQLPTEFSQNNLVNMSREHTINDGKEYLLADVAYEKYVQMSDAAWQEGISMKVVSAYRTEEYQRRLYNKRSGNVYVDNYTARPGFSEHQTGLAIDINSTSITFEYSSAFKWLQKHAHEYGFILRYPKGKEWITGYSYEPWHYRFVGTDAAKIIYEEGITYEEFYAKYVYDNEFR